MIGPRIFGIGLNKTGTTSLAEALRILGLTVDHSDERNTQRCVSCEWPEEIVGYLDGPIHRVKWILAKRFPDALFLLTERDYISWINSRIVHVLHNRVRQDGDPWQDIDTAAWQREFEDWHSDANRFHAEYPHRVLRWNVNEPLGWEPLCRFLKLDVPAVPFPKSNSGEWRLQEILKHYQSQASWPK